MNNDKEWLRKNPMNNDKERLGKNQWIMIMIGFEGMVMKNQWNKPMNNDKELVWKNQ